MLGYTVRMRLACVLLVLLFPATISNAHAGEQQASIEISLAGPQPDDRQWELYEDESIRMVAVNYGHTENLSTPGLFVFRKATSDWVRVDRISTKGATFGHSPTIEECRTAGRAPPSIGWNFRDLAGQPLVELPLTAAGFLFFPDKVERTGGEYVLRFNSGWEIPGVETVLRFSAGDLHQP